MGNKGIIKRYLKYQDQLDAEQYDKMSHEDLIEGFVASELKENEYEANLILIEHLQQKSEKEGLTEKESAEIKEVAEKIVEYEEKNFPLGEPTAEDVEQFNKEQGIKE